MIAAASHAAAAAARAESEAEAAVELPHRAPHTREQAAPLRSAIKFEMHEGVQELRGSERVHVFASGGAAQGQGLAQNEKSSR